MDLGILTGACIARPQICGIAGEPGAAVAFWVKYITLSSPNQGIVLSGGATTTHFEVSCTSFYLE